MLDHASFMVYYVLNLLGRFTILGQVDSRGRDLLFGVYVSRVLIFVQLKPCAMSGVRDSFLTVFKRTFSSTCRIVTLKSNQH